MKKIKRLLSQNIRHLRGERSMAVIAEAAGLPFRTYVAIDMGETWPRIDNLGAIAKALGVPVSRLFRDKDSEPTPSEALEILRRLIEGQEKPDPRIGRIVDVLSKNPAAITQVLTTLRNYSTLTKNTE